MFKRIVSLTLCICCFIGLFVMNTATVSAAENNTLSCSFISDSANRKYVEEMINFYLYDIENTDKTCSEPATLTTLRSGKPVVFFFEGASDLAHKDYTKYRNAAVCIVLKWNTSKKAPYIAFYSESCSTLPDHPLSYGAYSHSKGKSYGTATLVDGVYKIYTTNHNGYAAFNVRTIDGKSSVNAVYMKKNGYSTLKATGINIHTRTSSKVSSASNPWSAGCLLIGDTKNFSDFKNFISATYPSTSKLSNTTYKNQSIKRCSSGTSKEAGLLVVDRYLYRDEMMQIYKNQEAVDTITKFSVEAYKHSPCTYNNKGICTKCGDEFKLTSIKISGTYRVVEKCSSKKTPYSAASSIKTYTKYNTVTIVAYTRNCYGNVWCLTKDGTWIYSGHLQRLSGGILPPK